MATTRFCLIGLTVSEDKTMFTGMLITLCTALAFAAAMAPLYAQTSPATIAAIQATLQNYPKQMLSLSCELTITTTLDESFLHNNSIPESAMPLVQVAQDRCAIKGDKVIAESELIEGDATTLKHGMRTVSLADGNNIYKINLENGGQAGGHFTSGTRQHQRGGPSYWSPLRFGYKFNGQWLSDVLSSNNPTLERAGTDPMFGPLYLVHLNIGKREEHIWFAPKYGNVAVKIMEGAPDNGAVWTGSHYKRIGGLWIPLAGDWRLVVTRPNQPTVVQVDENLTFTDVQVNSVPDEAFDFKWPTGATLYDNDTRTRYFRDASGNWVKRMDIAEAISHIPSRVSAADFAPWVLLVSLATLFMLGYLRWRRRASA